MRLRVLDVLPPQTLDLSRTTSPITFGLSSSYPASSSYLYPLSFSEWKQEPNSLHANDVEGSPTMAPQTETHLPGEGWPPRQREGPSGPGPGSGRPRHCAAGPGSVAGTRWQTPWLCGDVGACRGERVLTGRVARRPPSGGECDARRGRKVSARNRAKRRTPTCHASVVCIHRYVYKCMCALIHVPVQAVLQLQETWLLGWRSEQRHVSEKQSNRQRATIGTGGHLPAGSR